MSIRLTLAGAAAPAALLLALVPGLARADVDWDRGRTRDAVNLCLDRARDVLRDRGNRRDLEVGRIDRADEDNDRVRVEGVFRSRDRDDDRRGRVDCEVNFRGENKVSRFDEDEFLSSWRDSGDDRDRDRNRDRDRDDNGLRRDVRQDANQACRRAARDEGYDVDDFLDQEREGDDFVRVKMNLRKRGDRFYATCAYNRDRDDARLARVEDRR